MSNHLFTSRTGVDLVYVSRKSVDVGSACGPFLMNDAFAAAEGFGELVAHVDRVLYGVWLFVLVNRPDPERRNWGIYIKGIWGWIWSEQRTLEFV